MKINIKIHKSESHQNKFRIELNKLRLYYIGNSAAIHQGKYYVSSYIQPKQLRCL